MQTKNCINNIEKNELKLQLRKERVEEHIMVVIKINYLALSHYIRVLTSLKTELLIFEE